MNRRNLRLMLSAFGTLGVGALAGTLHWSGIAWATPPFQFNSETLSRSRFEEIRINATPGHNDGFKAQVKVQEPSDVFVVHNRLPPGGHTGWHTHPGPSIVSVKVGTATLYDGDDPSCTPVTYPAGTGFIDKGGGHVHILRNEGNVELETVVFSIVPAGADRRLDAPAPGFCPF